MGSVSEEIDNLLHRQMNLVNVLDKTPFFSVVIPTFNRLGILNRAIDSVLDQSYGNFELIIVDNGSTDNTGEWLKRKYSDPRIQ